MSIEIKDFIRTEEEVFKELTESNNGLIPKDLQRVMWDSKVAVLGIGMGSAVVHQSVMHGFRRFMFADPDTVSYSNLNRQWFTREQAEREEAKVEAVREQVLTINPYSECELFREGVGFHNIDRIVQEADIIVDAMDPFDALPQSLALDEVARLKGKKVLYPIELGYGGAVYIFGPGTMSLAEFLGIKGEDISEGLRPELMGKIAESLLKDADSLAREMARKYMLGDIAKYPQLPGVTYSAAGRTIRIAMQILSVEKLGREFMPEKPYVLTPQPNIIEW